MVQLGRFEDSRKHDKGENMSPYKNKDKQREWMRNYMRDFRKRRKREEIQIEKMKERKRLKWLAPLGEGEDPFPNVDELLKVET